MGNDRPDKRYPVGSLLKCERALWVDVKQSSPTRQQLVKLNEVLTILAYESTVSYGAISKQLEKKFNSFSEQMREPLELNWTLIGLVADGSVVRFPCFADGGSLMKYFKLIGDPRDCL